MKNRIIVLVVGMILLLFSFLSAQAPDTLWRRTPALFYPDVDWTNLYRTSEYISINNDTIMTNKVRLLSFCLAYRGGVCISGKQLKNVWSGGMGFTPIFDWFYWLNSIEGSILYSINKNRGFEAGVGWGIANLNKRVGLKSLIFSDSTTSSWLVVGTSENWKIDKYFLFALKKENHLKYGLELILAKTRNIESLVQFNPTQIIENHNVSRYCIGGGIILQWERENKLLNNVSVNPYLSINLGFAREFRNNSPWEWNEKLNLYFTGVFIGIRFIIAK